MEIRTIRNSKSVYEKTPQVQGARVARTDGGSRGGHRPEALLGEEDELFLADGRSRRESEKMGDSILPMVRLEEDYPTILP